MLRRNALHSGAEARDEGLVRGARLHPARVAVAVTRVGVEEGRDAGRAQVGRAVLAARARYYYRV